jgi:hypothetical protein
MNKSKKSTPRCLRCRHDLTVDDRQRWKHQFSSSDVRWWNGSQLCCVCIEKLSSDKKSGTSLDVNQINVYLLFREAEKQGIDLLNKVEQIEKEKLIQHLQAVDYRNELKTCADLVPWVALNCRMKDIPDWFVHFKEIEKVRGWVNAGFTYKEAASWEFKPVYWNALRWALTGLPVNDAVVWAQEGFLSRPDDARGWNNLNVSPDLAKKAESLQLTLEVVSKLNTRFDFSPSLFINEVVNRAHELQEVHQASRNVGASSATRFTDSLIHVAEELQKVGLAVTVQNLMKYWGLAHDVILHVVDNDIKSRHLIDAIQLNLPENQWSLAEFILDEGIPLKEMSRLLESGLTWKQFTQYAKSREKQIRLLSLWRELPDSPIEDLHAWSNTNLAYGEIREWRKRNFSPEQALTWHQGKFTPTEATGWIQSGVNDVLIAQRRRDAGIRPTRL